MKLTDYQYRLIKELTRINKPNSKQSIRMARLLAMTFKGVVQHG